MDPSASPVSNPCSPDIGPVALLYSSAEERLAAVADFLQEGLARQEACWCLGSSDDFAGFAEALRARGVDADGAAADGRLIPLPGGPLAPAAADRADGAAGESLEKRLSRGFAAARAGGACGVRVTRDMGWAAEAGVSPEELAACEARNALFFEQAGCAALCQYDLGRFQPPLALAVLEAHPWVMHQGRRCQNLYHLPPHDQSAPRPAEAEVHRLLRNLLEREQAREQLRDSEDRYRRLLAAATSYTYTVWFRDGVVESTEHGPGCAAVTGYTPEDYRNLNHLWFSMIHQPDREMVLAHVRRILQGGEMPPIEHRIVHRDGSLRWIRNTVVPFRDPAGRLLRYDGVVEDISERKRAQEAFVAASRMEATATLAGGIAHDFNNLMMGVMGNAELLRMAVPADGPATGMIDGILKAAQRAGDLSRQMLAYARGGKYQVKKLRIDEIIRQTLPLTAVPDPRIRVEEDHESAPWEVEADPAQMGQVFMNLFANALEALPEGGRIVIRTRNVEADEAFSRSHPGLRAGPALCLSIEDDGCGMSPATLQRAFEPFFSTKFQGRGLGLAAAYGITVNHGGHIALSSRERSGTTAAVWLPAIRPQIPMPAGAEGAIPTGTETILLIDSDEMVLTVTCKLLEHLGYRVFTCRNGAKAFGMIQTYGEEIHLALLDVAMPDLGSAGLLRLLRKARPNMRIIVSCGYEGGEWVREYREAGADGFIQRPFQLENLGRGIRATLDS